LERELATGGIAARRQVPVPIRYLGLEFEEGFRADLIIENLVIVELKSVEQMSKTHHKQLLTYLRLMGIRLGFLLNFGAPLMKEGIFRIVSGLEIDPHGSPLKTPQTQDRKWSGERARRIAG
jgi:GxxExxY protein